MKAGALNRLVTIQQRTAGTDDAGQPLETWEDVGTAWANIGHDTGKGAIRLSGNIPKPYVQYSFKVRFSDIARLSVTDGMRVSHDGEAFDIKGITRDFKDRGAAYIVCELGGNVG